jgi:SPP1 gp7 family putative phage head morphogenesis protein
VSDIYQPAFWDNEDRLFWLFISEEYAKLISNGVAGGIDGLPPQVRALVNWDLINKDVLRYSREYRYGDIKNIDDTTREFVQEAVTDWIQSGDPLDELVRMLKPKFDAIRAEMIASTEVTRLYSTGNRIAWESAGTVRQVRFMTAQDELVCPICGERAGQVFDLTDSRNHPPAHPRCRCWIQPIVDVDMVGERIGEALDAR